MPAGILSAVRMMNYGTAGLDASTKLLCHFDGANGATSFTDTSASAHTLTANGSVAVSTSNSKFGGACATYNGSTDYIAVTGSLADFNVGTGDFTIEAWLRATSFAAQNGRAPTIFASGDVVATNGAYSFYIDTAAGHLSFGSNNGSFSGVVASTTNVADGTLRHVAAVRTSGTIKLFVNGAQEASTAVGTSFGTPAYCLIGANTTTPAGCITGNTDEFRFSTVARWTAAFTVPAIPYS